MHIKKNKALFLMASLTVLTAILAGCGGGKSQNGEGQAPPPPEVGVTPVTPGVVELVTELPGRLEAYRVAQVRARVAGILQKRMFEEGSDVKEGQQLFQIDNAPYAADLQSAKASVAQAEADLMQTRALADRYRPLVPVNAVSKQDYDNAVAAMKASEANLAAAKAALTNAQISLGYASVTSPISGRIGRSLVTEGALVGQGEATPLAVVQQIDPMYINFTQSASEALKLRSAMQSGQFKKASGKDAASVRIVLEDGSTYGQPGRLLFSDLSVDPTTGQITLRAEVPNPKGDLLPGLYVRVQLEQAQATNAITLPQQAVTRTQKGDEVTVVGPDGKLSKRAIRVGGSKDGKWVVLDGLKNGEQVMVDGFQALQRMPPDVTVKAVPWAPAVPANGAAAPAESPAASGTQ